MANLISNQKELSMLMHESKKTDYKTHYNFIRAHNGYRKGKIHLAIGPSSGGKSTLTRSLILDFLLSLKFDEFVHVHLSEESEIEFLIEIGSTGLGFDKIKQIIITSEQDNEYKNENDLFLKLNESLSNNKVMGLFFDNITTSFCYIDKKTSTQADISLKIKKLCKINNIPIILIAHTGGDSTMASSRLIEMNDIRGGKSLTNIVEFMYILQPIFVENTRYNIIRVVKHRGTTLTNPYFKLEYSSKSKLFTCDTSIEFKEFKGIFNKRNVL